MRTAGTVIAVLSAGFLAWAPPLAARDDSRDSQIVRCESDDGRTRECPVGRVRDARMLRQLSRSACVEGESWGITRRSLWVARGCRGEFLVLGSARGRDEYGHGPDAGASFVCESDRGRWNHCAAPVRRGVELVRQLSRSACVRGRSWGVDARGVWVNGGCRAEFRLGGRGWDAPEVSRLRCESSDGRPRFCALDHAGDVRLVRQLSRSPCVEGQTWGRGRGGIWVEQGCRGEFEVGSGWAYRD